MPRKRTKKTKSVETLVHEEATSEKPAFRRASAADARERTKSTQRCLPDGVTATWILNLCGEGRTRKTGRTWLSMRRRSISKSECIPRRSLTIYANSHGMGMQF